MAFDWGSAIGGLAQLGSAYLGSQASKNAGNTAAKGSDAATALQGSIYQDQRALNMPFYNSQLSALNQYNALLGLPGVSNPQQSQQQYVTRNAQGVPIANAQLYASDPAYKAAWDATVAQHQGQWKTGYWSGSDANWIDSNIRSRMPAQASGTQQAPGLTQQQAFAAFRNQPGYQFGLDQGQKALQSSAAASGGLFSGKAGKALVKFGTDYADQQGFTPYVNRIAAAAGIGQTNPVGALTGAAGNYAQNAGGLMQNAATQRASGLLGSAQAWQQGLNGAGYFANKLGTNQGWWG